MDAKALNPVKTTSIYNALRMVERCATNPIRGWTRQETNIASRRDYRQAGTEAQVAMISPWIRKIEDTLTRTCWRLRCCINRIPFDPGL
jgi:hypothetical protein